MYNHLSKTDYEDTRITLLRNIGNELLVDMV